MGLAVIVLDASALLEVLLQTSAAPLIEAGFFPPARLCMLRTCWNWRLPKFFAALPPLVILIRNEPKTPSPTFRSSLSRVIRTTCFCLVFGNWGLGLPRMTQSILRELKNFLSLSLHGTGVWLEALGIRQELRCFKLIFSMKNRGAPHCIIESYNLNLVSVLRFYFKCFEACEESSFYLDWMCRTVVLSFPPSSFASSMSA